MSWFLNFFILLYKVDSMIVLRNAFYLRAGELITHNS